MIAVLFEDVSQQALPQILPDRIYELWAIADNEPVPAGIFTVNEAGLEFLGIR
jgi:hypothetical protein